MSGPTRMRDYSLVGPEAQAAQARGPASGPWRTPPLSRIQLKEPMRRTDGPALRDTALWLLALALSGAVAFRSWGSRACVPFFAIYGLL